MNPCVVSRPLTKAQRQRSCCEGHLLSSFEWQSLHGLRMLAHNLEFFQYAESAVDHLALDVALVRDANVLDDVSDHEPVAADKTEHACEHLVGACAVMAVDQNDLVCFGASRVLPHVAHANHVLGELGLSFHAAVTLGDHEGLKAFLAQAAQDVDGRNVGVALGAAGVRAWRED